MTVLSCCSASVMQRQEKKKIARTECSIVTVKGVSEDLGQEHVGSSRKKKKSLEELEAGGGGGGATDVFLLSEVGLDDCAGG